MLKKFLTFGFEILNVFHCNIQLIFSGIIILFYLKSVLLGYFWNYFWVRTGLRQPLFETMKEFSGFAKLKLKNELHFRTRKSLRSLKSQRRQKLDQGFSRYLLKAVKLPLTFFLKSLHPGSPHSPYANLILQKQVSSCLCN